MSAVIGMETPVKDILELLPGIRIAKVLWDIKSDFFDFFRENGKYNLGITCSPGSPSVSADSRYRVWVKITQSLNDFCKAKVDVLEKSAANFDELRESMANLDSVQLFNAEFLKSLMNDEDRKSMEFFCVIFVILIKTEFPARWDEIETKMEPEILRSFKEYLLKFGQSISDCIRESLNLRNCNSSRLSIYNLLDQIDQKCEQIQSLQSELTDLKKNQQFIKDENTKYRHQIAYLQNSLVDKKNEISVLNQRCAQFKEDLFFEGPANLNQQSYELKLSLEKIKQENQSVCFENQELKKELSYLRDQLNSKDTEISEMRNMYLISSETDLELKLQEKSLINHQIIDENMLKEQRIACMHNNTKLLREKIIELGLCLEKQKKETLDSNKRWLEQRKTSAELDSNLKAAHREISRLKKDLDELEGDKLSVLKSNIRLKDESEKLEKQLEDSEQTSKYLSSDSDDISRYNMEKCLEDSVFYLLEELNSYNSLLHDIFVRELTGEGLQDLVNKKLFHVQTRNVDFDQLRRLNAVPLNPVYA